MVPIVDTQLAEINISSHLEQYNSNNVTVLIDYSLTPQDLILYSSFQVVPVPVEIEIVRQRSVRMQVLYNTLYNVSITGPCAMNSQSIMLFYGKFLKYDAWTIHYSSGLFSQGAGYEHKLNAYSILFL